jgi:hypothetical protein
MLELIEAEWRVAESLVLIDRQRQLIEQLEDEGSDVASAQVVLDSLLVSLDLHMRYRDRLLQARAIVRWQKYFQSIQMPRGLLTLASAQNDAS